MINIKSLENIYKDEIENERPEYRFNSNDKNLEDDYSDTSSTNDLNLDSLLSSSNLQTPNCSALTGF